MYGHVSPRFCLREGGGCTQATNAGKYSLYKSHFSGKKRTLCLLQHTKSLSEVPKIFKHKFRNSLLLWTMPAVRSQTLVKYLAEVMNFKIGQRGDREKPWWGQIHDHHKLLVTCKFHWKGAATRLVEQLTGFREKRMKKSKFEWLTKDERTA